MSGIDELKMSVLELEKQFDILEERLKKMRAQIKTRFKTLFDDYQSSQINGEFLEDFVKEPYVLIPKKGHEWYVLVPKFVKMQVGYLDHTTKSYNVFIVNKYVRWLSEIPSVLEEKLKFPEPLPFKVINGVLHTGKSLQEKALQKYKGFLSRREGKDRIRIKKGYEFKLIARLIEDGTLPFVPKPVSESDLREWTGSGYEKYLKICKEKSIVEIQNRAWKEFVERGAIGIFWAFASGKSLFGHRLIGRVKGPHLVIVPTLTLKEQWLERLNIFNPETKNEVRVETYHSYGKVQKGVKVGKKRVPWSIIIFDECQHLPARTYIRLSTIQAKYRVGFSGSPFREDGKENYIFALTGYPIGMSWDELLKLGIVKAPSFRVYIVQDKRAKDKKLDELLEIPIKTIIFCDSLDYGDFISKRYGIPFVYSATKDRLEIIRESDFCVVSRVGDEGVSIQDIERVIEVAFLFGSRMQESQRFGRLMHSAKNAQHIIIMTEREFNAYHKRLNAILQRGFKIEFIR